MYKTYFIQSGADGPIKIGKALDVQKRLKSLQTGSAETLVLLGWLDQDKESHLHSLFSQHRLPGRKEHFRAAEIILNFIAAYCEKPTRSSNPPRPFLREPDYHRFRYRICRQVLVRDDGAFLNHPDFEDYLKSGLNYRDKDCLLDHAESGNDRCHLINECCCDDCMMFAVASDIEDCEIISAIGWRRGSSELCLLLSYDFDRTLEAIWNKYCEPTQLEEFYEMFPLLWRYLDYKAIDVLAYSPTCQLIEGAFLGHYYVPVSDRPSPEDAAEEVYAAYEVAVRSGRA